MPSNLFLVLFVCLGLFSTFRAVAQVRFENAVELTRENGLPAAEIRCIRKGEDGFMWIGTTDGLCRFDGSVFKPYNSIPGDSNSLLSNSILDVVAEKDFVWVGTTKGLSRIDVRSGLLKHFQFSGEGSVPVDSVRVNQGVSVLSKDRAGDLFAGTNAHGIFRYNRTSDRFESFTHNETFFDDPEIREGAHTVLSISEDPTNDSLLYVGAYSGLWRVNKKTGTLKWYFQVDQDKEEQIHKNNFKRILVHPNGKIYFGAWRGGIGFFDRVNQTFGKVKIDDPVANGSLVSILLGRDNAILISTINGMIEYDTDTDEIISVKKNDPSNNRYYGANFIDEEKRAWLFTFQALYIFDPVLQQFNTFRYGDITKGWSFAFYSRELSEHELVIVPRHEPAIYHFDYRTEVFDRVPVESAATNENVNFVTRGISPAPDGTITISTDMGLFSYDPKTRGLLPHRFRPILRHNRYRDVLWDTSGNLWLAADRDGLLCWNPKENAVRHFLQELSPPDTTMTLSHLDLLTEDGEGNVWFARNGGIGVYIRKKDTVKNFIFTLSPQNSFNQVIGATHDGDGRIWFSDRDGRIGFAREHSPADGIVRKVDLRTKYDVECLYDIVHDRSGNLWGHGSAGLVKFNTRDFSCDRFTFAYGKMQDDFYSLAILRDGDILLGGRNSIVVADPGELKPNAEHPVPYLTEIEVLQTSQKLLDSLWLKHWQNSFAFGFSARAYTLGKQTRFRYRLLPFEEEWVEAKERRFANYTNIAPGEYTFELQAANNEGVWNPVTTTVRILISEAWWVTWWFQAAVLTAVVMVSYSLYRWRITQHRQQIEQQIHFEKKLAQVEMSALRAQMNPHFLFNSLNSIDRYIIRNESRKASEYLNNFARLIRMILNNSRTNHVSLKEELEALTLYLEMECLRFSDKFVYNIEVDPAIDVDLISIPPMLIQPFVENAIWHGLMPKETSGEEKMVGLCVKRDDDVLRFIIEDNGVGRERSGTLKTKRDIPSRRSMGMQITSDRMEIIKKLYGLDISVHIEDLRNEDGSARGTRVEFAIALG